MIDLFIGMIRNSKINLAKLAILETCLRGQILKMNFFESLSRIYLV